MFFRAILFALYASTIAASLGFAAPAQADCSNLRDSSCSRGELTFLQILQQHGFDVSGSKAGNLIAVGKSTCADSQSGDTMTAVRNLWQSNNGNISMQDAALIVTAARPYLCR
ncbi:DUF732 domain-containing protein [Mycobacterium intracellulare]|uniref:DUF732 domain-containing protein n=1 Tax=Mycobacterium intracellulare TaxID=1767 RepID=A0AAE4UEA4_MYCIT|nr:DUF732 domain-containing protein [Mycobacterium intracellulare]MDV6979881.1 DUF732 domain-containing protein [Mycobacterium intracellulare]MDV6985392.1 DUF732 domain-containing protein [Mycobacterium intracellulare]MDV7015672.1 DUF732 domain-containing protein [Mycobacterium intracellulare]MDV7030383.1 DUF732 domain-containing protein [Mycobacterium intracellulare]